MTELADMVEELLDTARYCENIMERNSRRTYLNDFESSDLDKGLDLTNRIIERMESEGYNKDTVMVFKNVRDYLETRKSIPNTIQKIREMIVTVPQKSVLSNGLKDSKPGAEPD